MLEGNVPGTLGISRQSPLAPAVRHAAAWGRLQEAETASKAEQLNQRFSDGDGDEGPRSGQKSESN